jgi:hemoglobin
VHTFYSKTRKDPLLGPIFNSHIPDENWPTHLEKLTDFGETNLLGISKFKGFPNQKHLAVDHNLNHTISLTHFGQWLNLWFETIDTHFESPIATKAKESSKRMAHGQIMTLWNHRPQSYLAY